MTTLSTSEWTVLAAQHSTLVSPYTDEFVKRRSLGKKHPVHDFLFTYYSCSPLKLKQWVPSIDQSLSISENIHHHYPWLGDEWFFSDGSHIRLNKKRIGIPQRHTAHFIAKLCDQILKKAPRFGCFGLHEWAMVYKTSPSAIRHQGYPLRLSMSSIDIFVESQAISCTHYDAYRFFTQEARPLNAVQPTIESRLQMEQGGCVHANMDLYKWATKLWPWIGSEFIRQAFFHALACRELDMRASPYNLVEEGYLPICIETEEGRKLYQQEQQRLAMIATPLRKELQQFCLRFLEISE